MPFALFAWWLVLLTAWGDYDTLRQQGMHGISHSLPQFVFSLMAGLVALGGVVITRGRRWTWSARGERLVGLCNLAAAVAAGLLFVVPLFG